MAATDNPASEPATPRITVTSHVIDLQQPFAPYFLAHITHLEGSLSIWAGLAPPGAVEELERAEGGSAAGSDDADEEIRRAEAEAGRGSGPATHVSARLAGEWAVAMNPNAGKAQVSLFVRRCYPAIRTCLIFSLLLAFAQAPGASPSTAIGTSLFRTPADVALPMAQRLGKSHPGLLAFALHAHLVPNDSPTFPRLVCTHLSSQHAVLPSLRSFYLSIFHRNSFPPGALRSHQRTRTPCLRSNVDLLMLHERECARFRLQRTKRQLRANLQTLLSARARQTVGLERRRLWTFKLSPAIRISPTVAQRSLPAFTSTAKHHILQLFFLLRPAFSASHKTCDDNHEANRPFEPCKPPLTVPHDLCSHKLECSSSENADDAKKESEVNGSYVCAPSEVGNGRARPEYRGAIGLRTARRHPGRIRVLAARSAGSTWFSYITQLSMLSGSTQGHFHATSVRPVCTGPGLVLHYCCWYKIWKCQCRLSRIDPLFQLVNPFPPSLTVPRFQFSGIRL